MRFAAPMTHLLLALVACKNDPEPDPVTEPGPEPVQRDLLSAEARLVRASIATRGTRPSPAELEQIRANPEALAELVDAYVESPAFGETIKDMHGELFLTRTDADDQLPSVGLAADYTANQIHAATADEPLELVRYVVENDLPYTEIVTADYTLSNEVMATLYGIDIDPEVQGWRKARWPDGRPHAGVLSSSQLWRRHVSAGSNFHRLRANVLAETLLCESFAERDVTVDGGVDLTDEAAVAQAVRENPNCIACHQALDPLAATLWGFKRQIDPRAVEGSHENDACAPDPDQRLPPIDEGDLPTDYCYPLVMYTPAKEDRWEELDLRPPGFYGTPASDLVDLGQLIASDPRFAQCTVRRFYGWFSQQDPDHLPLSLIETLHDDFVASGYNAKALTKEILLSEPYAAVTPAAEGDAPLLSLRPDAYAAIVEDLTGFEWRIQPMGACGNSCWTEVDLTTSDRWGYRALFGGIDGFQVLLPTHTATPNKVLVLQRLSAEAASYVVEHDFAAAAADRRLLSLVEPDTTDQASVEAQLVALHDRVLGTHTDEDIAETWGLFDATRQATDTTEAWTLVISLLLQDPRLVYY